MIETEHTDNTVSVGIILTTYNGELFLADQLDSLLLQDGVEVHIYAFDDQSSDRTMDILQAYADANADRFTLFQNTPNSGGTGLNIMRNLKNVPDSHDYYALADQDDIWMPEKLHRAITTMRQDKSDLYFSNLSAWDGKETMLGIVRKDAPLQRYDHLFGGGSAGCTYLLNARFFRHVKDIVAQTNIDGVRRISHDWILYFLARHLGYSVTASPDALIKYRIHVDSQYGTMSLGGFAALKRKFGMLRNGFLRDQVRNALRFAQEGTAERAILLRYDSGFMGRLSTLLQYRTQLVRGRSRFLPLVIASLLLY